MGTSKSRSKPVRIVARATTPPEPVLGDPNRLGAALGIVAVVIGALWGYFGLQRDTAENKASILALQIVNTALTKQISDGQEKEAALVTALFKQVNDRVEGIDKNGTAFGHYKIDNRTDEIAEVKARIGKVESAFAEIIPKIARIDDHVEQMWGDYNSRSIPAAERIEPKRLPR